MSKHIFTFTDLVEAKNEGVKQERRRIRLAQREARDYLATVRNGAPVFKTTLDHARGILEDSTRATRPKKRTGL